VSATTGRSDPTPRLKPPPAAPATQAGADGRRRQPRGDARRQQIIDAAIELFAERGFRGTGIAPLAERVGVSHPALLYYFGTKERLLLEVAAERERVESSLFDDKSDRMEWLHDLVRFNSRSPTLIRLYIVLAAENLDESDPLHSFFVNRYKLARQLMSHMLRVEQRAGTVGPDADIAQLSREILATLLGLEMQWLIDPDSVDLVTSVDGYIDGLRQRLNPNPHE